MKKLKELLKESEQKLGPPEPYDPRNPEHNDPSKYKIFPGSVWDHVLDAIRYNKLEDPLINLSLMMHDVGKGVTLQYNDNGMPTYKGHDAAGADIIDTIADRLKMSNKERETLKFVAVNHMKIFKLKDMKPSKIAKIVGHEDWNILLATAKADEMCRKHLNMSEREYDKLIQIAIDIKNRWGISQGKKAIKLVDGNYAMRITGLKPSKKLGDIIKKTTEWILDNNITDQNEIDDYIRSLT